MRFLLLLCAFTVTAVAAVPPELATALKTFRTDGPRGWAFTQTTSAEGKSLAERFDPGLRDDARWKLVQQNGQPPTVEERSAYLDGLHRRAQGATAPKLTEQFDLATLETVTDTPERGTYRCKLKPAEIGDETSAFLRITLVVHKPAQTIESVEVANIAPFSPTYGVKIAEMKTTMTYSLPAAAVPSLLQKVTTRLRGRAFWMKSLDADMLVTFTDYVKAGKQ